MAAWSEKTKKLLMEVDSGISEFVLKGWNRGSLESVSRSWRDFLESESRDAVAQGLGLSKSLPVSERGFRDVPYTALSSLDFLKGLGADERAFRERVFGELDALMIYFHPWDWDSNEPLSRGVVGIDGSVKSVPAMRVRFRVLDENSKLVSEIAKAKLERVTGEVERLTGFDRDGDVVDFLGGVISENRVLIAGSVCVLMVMVYLARGSK